MNQKYGPTDRYEILPGEVREHHIPTGELTYRSMLTDSGTETALPDTDTEIAHGLGVVPSELVLVPQTTGVIGYLLESARSATSITIRANTSGVDGKWTVIG